MKNRRLAPFGLQISGFVFAPFYRILLGGVSEIRTRDTLLAYTRFPGVPLQPLEHHSSFLRLQR